MQDFEMTIYIKADPPVVWDAIVGDEGNRAVMWGTVLRGELEPGGEFQYVGPGENGSDIVHVYGEVIEAQPGVILQLTEHPGPTYGDNHAELSSRVTWRLQPDAIGVTRLTLTNDEWSVEHPAQADAAETWPRVLSSLKSLIETGEAIPPHHA